MSRIEELENCTTLEEVDNFLCTQTDVITTKEKCDYLKKYMGIIGVYLDGGDSDTEFLYSLLRESFCDGDWRLLCSDRK
ncbi:MAG: hypothetical protein LBC73_01070 [Oscillospiraceae bacterium]|jgi:hypothetical protein|nr:hypothetical protein [Oscillospiraceae bacterium]